MEVKGGVLVIDVEKLAHDLAIVSLSQRLAVEIRESRLTKGKFTVYTKIALIRYWIR